MTEAQIRSKFGKVVSNIHSIYPSSTWGFKYEMVKRNSLLGTAMGSLLKVNAQIKQFRLYPEDIELQLQLSSLSNLHQEFIETTCVLCNSLLSDCQEI